MSKIGFRYGLLASACLLGLVLLAALVVAFQSYDGRCISFEPPPTDCTLLEYLPGYAFLLLIYWAFGRPLLSIACLALLLLLPLGGYLLGRRASPLANS